MKSTDARYTKFLDAFTETMVNTVVGDIMSKDYETLLRNKVLTSLHEGQIPESDRFRDLGQTHQRHDHLGRLRFE
jgi:hypothetical protein